MANLYCIADFYQILDIHSTLTKDQLIKKFQDTEMSKLHTYAYASLLEYYDLVNQMHNELQILHDEITRIAKYSCHSELQILLKNEFVADLNQSYAEIKNKIKYDLDINIFNLASISSYVKEPAPQITKQLTHTLKKLTFKPEHQKNGIQALQSLHSTTVQKCEENPTWKNFCGCIFKIAFTGLGFLMGTSLMIAGTPLSIGIGLLVGLVGMLAIGVSLFKPEINAVSNDYKTWKNVKNEMMQDLTFQTPIYSSLKNAAHTGLKLFDSKPQQAEVIQERPSSLTSTMNEIPLYNSSW